MQYLCVWWCAQVHIRGRIRQPSSHRVYRRAPRGGFALRHQTPCREAAPRVHRLHEAGRRRGCAGSGTITSPCFRHLQWVAHMLLIWTTRFVVFVVVVVTHMDDQICCFCCCCCCFERRVKKGKVTPIFHIFSVLGDFVLYSTVSLTLVKEQRFIRIIFYYYYFTLFLLTTHPPTLFLGGRGAH